jgi:hypothetical protein
MTVLSIQHAPPIHSAPLRATMTPPKLLLKVHCGCGFSASSIDGGLVHSATTGHTCHITGEIRNSYR